jgi:hypothetical protein
MINQKNDREDATGGDRPGSPGRRVDPAGSVTIGRADG